MSNCHYGCWFHSQCFGDSREDVIEFLAQHDHSAADLARLSDNELDKILVDMADDDYRGPNHVKREAA